VIYQGRGICGGEGCGKEATFVLEGHLSVKRTNSSERAQEGGGGKLYASRGGGGTGVSF